jgi:hypothetical protein
MALRFLTYLVKPWDRLNHLLAQPLAFQPSLSDVTCMAGALAVSIRHQAEIAGISQQIVDTESTDNRAIVDIADAWKHGSLRNAARNNRLEVISLFEVDENERFRFLRNMVAVDHASFGELDFMRVSGAAIAYWIQRLELPLNWIPSLAEGENVFRDSAILHFDPNFQIEMTQTRIRTFRRELSGELVPFAPAEIRFEVCELGSDSQRGV